MQQFLRFFLDNPIILLVVGAWILGVIGNVLKAVKKARERAEAAGQLPSQRREVEPVQVSPPAPPPERTPARADEIAREMRRILGVETAPDEARSGDRVERTHRERMQGDEVAEPEQRHEPDMHARPRPVPPPLPSRSVRRTVAEPERAPTPVVPTTAGRRLTIHVDPHVGESIQHRATVRSSRVAGPELGNLGGRVQHGEVRRATGQRYALDDLKRVIVLSEILGPPLALRQPGERDF